MQIFSTALIALPILPRSYKICDIHLPLLLFIAIMKNPQNFLTSVDVTVPYQYMVSVMQLEENMQFDVIPTSKVDATCGPV